MNSDYQYELVWRYISQGQIPVAISSLKELLARDPNNAMYHGTLAHCLLEQMRLHAAEYELKLALRLEPNLPFLHCVYARIYHLQNKPKQALAACDQALQLSPQDEDIFELKADILIANQRYKEAFEYLQRMAQLRPDSVDTACAHARYYFETGDTKTALSFARDALRIDAQHLNSNVIMGHIQLALGDVAEAEYHARLAIMLNPTFAPALKLFASVKMRRNFVFGLWWRFNGRMARMSQLNQTAVLIFGYVFFNLMSNIVFDLGHPTTSTIVDYAWLSIVIYSWVGIPYYQRMLNKEMQKFSFKSDY